MLYTTILCRCTIHHKYNVCIAQKILRSMMDTTYSISLASAHLRVSAYAMVSNYSPIIPNIYPIAHLQSVSKWVNSPRTVIWEISGVCYVNLLLQRAQGKEISIQISFASYPHQSLFPQMSWSHEWKIEIVSICCHVGQHGAWVNAPV